MSLNPMQQAIELAQAAALKDEVPVGAVILHEGKVVGTGANHRETDQNPLGHAEIAAILDASRTLASWRLENCEVYVTLEPCPMCLGALQQARVKRVIFGATDPKGGALSLGYRLHEDQRTHHRFAVDFVPDAQCSQILSDFFKAKRR